MDGMVPTPLQNDAPALIKIDIGCGPNKQPGHIGIDKLSFDGVDHCIDAGSARLPFEDASVESAYSSHFLEHLNAVERCHLLNELYRVLIPGGKAQIIVPHWASCRAYGDPTHAWPPISEFFWYYLSKEWRMTNAPHSDAEHWPQGYNCDFAVTWGYSMNQAITMRSPDYQQFALANYKEAALDTIATLEKKASGAVLV